MIVVLTGKNEQGLQEELRMLTAAFIHEHGTSVERFDGSEITTVDRVIDAVRSISFLEPRKLIVIRDFSQSKELLERIEYIVEQTAESTDLVLIDQKLDKRTAAYKYLQKNVDIKEFKQLQDYEIEKWLIAESTSLGVTISPSNARLLLARVGNNQLRLEQELKKLAISGEEISKELINDLTDLQPQSKVFDMLDALFQGSLESAWRLYKDQRAQGEDPHKIIAMITWQLSQLTIAVHAPTKTVDTLKAAGVSPYGAQKLLIMSRSITKQQLRDYIEELARIDEQIKTSADVESALETYFVFVCSRK